MKPTADFLSQAQVCIEKVVRDYKPKLMAAYGNVEHVAKGDNSPVTELDLELEQLLRGALKNFDGKIGLQGEEHPPEGNPDTFWLIDPIDGTETFIRGIPLVRNMVTLIDNGEPVFAFVYRVNQDELLIAIKDKGTTLNGQPIHVSDRPLKRAYIELSADIADPDVYPIAKAVREQIYGYWMYADFTYIAMGKLEGHLVVKAPGGTWDYAPRALLFSEAGGKVANLGSDKYDYKDKNWFGASPIVFDALMPIINEQAKKVGLIK